MTKNKKQNQTSKNMNKQTGSVFSARFHSFDHFRKSLAKQHPKNHSNFFNQKKKCPPTTSPSPTVKGFSARKTTKSPTSTPPSLASTPTPAPTSVAPALAVAIDTRAMAAIDMEATVAIGMEVMAAIGMAAPTPGPAPTHTVLTPAGAAVAMLMAARGKRRRLHRGRAPMRPRATSIDIGKVGRNSHTRAAPELHAVE